MINLLNSLKQGGKRSNAEAEYQFMLYFYNLIDNKQYYLRINDNELNSFKNYQKNKTINEIKYDLQILFKNNLIGKTFLENNIKNVTIVSDFTTFGDKYPNISNIKDSIIYSSNEESKTLLEFQNILFDSNNKIYSSYDKFNEKSEKLYVDIFYSKYIIVPFDFIKNSNDYIFNLFQQLDLDLLLKEKDLILVGNYNDLKIDKSFLNSEINGTLIFNHSKTSSFEYKLIKSLPYTFISKFPSYDITYSNELNDTILNIILDKYKLSNKIDNIKDYINIAYENYKDVLDKDILEYKENKLLELEKIKNEIDLIDDFYSNKKFEISDF